MHYTLFMNLFFPKKKVLIGFFISLLFFLVLIGTRIVKIEQQYISILSSPNYVLTSTSSEGFMPSSPYKNNNALSAELQNFFGVKVGIYEASIFLSKSPYQKDLSFQMFAVDESFFSNQMSKFLTGSIPDVQKMEAVIGKGLSEKLNLGISDKLEVLDPRGEITQLIISGILKKGTDFFQDVVLITNDTNIDAHIPNVIWLYFGDTQLDESNNQGFYEIVGKYKVGRQDSIDIRKSGKINLLIEITALLLLGAVGALLLVANLTKGSAKKIGLLKAQGVSDTYINKLSLSGLALFVFGAVFIAIVCLPFINHLYNSGISRALSFRVKHFSISLTISFALYSYSFLLLVIMYLFVWVNTTKISPRQAMLNPY